MRFRSPMNVPLPDAKAKEFPEAVESYVLWLRRHYDFRARWHRRFYRFSGIVVIVIGAALPLLVSLEYAAKSVIVSLAGVLIAAISALHAFYRWDQSWTLLRNTETSVTDAWWHYQSQVGRDGADRPALALDLVRRVVQLRRQESEAFFEDMTFPTHAGADGLAGQR